MRIETKPVITYTYVLAKVLSGISKLLVDMRTSTPPHYCYLPKPNNVRE